MENSVFWVVDEGDIKMKIMAFVLLFDWVCWLSSERGHGYFGKIGRGKDIGCGFYVQIEDRKFVSEDPGNNLSGFTAVWHGQYKHLTAVT